MHHEKRRFGAWMQLLGRKLDHGGNMLLKDTGITVIQLRVLRYLKLHPERSQIADISDFFDVKHTSTIHVIRMLEEKGCVYREAIHRSRGKKILLTELGEKIAERNEDTIEQTERIMLDGFSEEEKVVLFHLLSKINDNLDKGFSFSKNKKDGTIMSGMESVKKIITFEEHYICPEVDAAYRKLVDQSRMSKTQKAKLASSAKWVAESPIGDIGQRRLQWMDENGVDMQVISYGDNSPADLPASESVALCREANDYLAEHCKKHPDRFAGFAVLPVDAPEKAATEAVRAVKELGLKGISFKATYRGEEFLDSRRFAPIFDAIGELNVPITFHPNETVPAVTKSYYEGDSISPVASMLLSGFGIGWHYETGVAYLRLIVSGLLDKYPSLNLLIGHWGEVLPYYFDRLDMAFDNIAKGLLKKSVSDYFRENMYVMPSGLVNDKVMDTMLKVCLDEFGADRIVWSNDYPYRLDAALANTRDWINKLEVSPEDKEKIAHMNGEKLLGL